MTHILIFLVEIPTHCAHHSNPRQDLYFFLEMRLVLGTRIESNFSYKFLANYLSVSLLRFCLLLQSLMFFY